jgi:hypothetical protein
MTIDGRQSVANSAMHTLVVCACLAVKISSVLVSYERTRMTRHDFSTSASTAT